MFVPPGCSMSVHRRERSAPREEPPTGESYYDDVTGRDHAVDLNDDFSCWWVYWSLSRRSLYAFYLGPALVRPLCARRVQQLRDVLRSDEARLHAPPVAHHRSAPTPPTGGGDS